MSFVIPKQRESILIELLSLSQTKYDDLLKILLKAPRTFNYEKIEKYFIDNVKIKVKDSSALFSFLAELEFNFYNEKYSAGNFKEILIDSIKLTKNKELISKLARIDLLIGFIDKLFKSDSAIRLLNKSTELYVSFDKIFRNVKIISDIRPYIKDKITESLVVHHLIIKYSKNNSNKKITLTLDSDDLINIKDIIEKAIIEDKKIKKNLKDFGIKEVK